MLTREHLLEAGKHLTRSWMKAKVRLSRLVLVVVLALCRRGAVAQWGVTGAERTWGRYRCRKFERRLACTSELPARLPMKQGIVSLAPQAMLLLVI